MPISSKKLCHSRDENVFEVNEIQRLQNKNKWLLLYVPNTGVRTNNSDNGVVQCSRQTKQAKTQ
jgi:hypothetical protein